MKHFHEMALSQGLNSTLQAIKFKSATPVQASVIPQALEGLDIVACAETGSGKTAAYLIPMIERLLKAPQAGGLVLAPTRELAQQIADFTRVLLKHDKKMQVVTLVGGADIRKQLNALKRGPRILVATPGRLIDHLKRQKGLLKATQILVLDEGDRMLDMGFAPQLDEILQFLPKQKQCMLFTATLNPRIQKLSEKYLSQPALIKIGQTSMPVSSIKQSVVQINSKGKDNRIVDELNERSGSVIVFMSTKHRTNTLAKYLSEYGFAVDVIHGGRSQGQRNLAIRNFKQGKSRILCATDVAARGIDVPHVEHVINFDLPRDSEDYVHRVGRTARNGATGEAVSFVTPGEHRVWMGLVRKYKIKGADLEGTASSQPDQLRSKKKYSSKKCTKRASNGQRRSRRFR